MGLGLDADVEAEYSTTMDVAAPLPAARNVTLQLPIITVGNVRCERSST